MIRIAPYFGNLPILNADPQTAADTAVGAVRVVPAVELHIGRSIPARAFLQCHCVPYRNVSVVSSKPNAAYRELMVCRTVQLSGNQCAPAGTESEEAAKRVAVSAAAALSSLSEKRTMKAMKAQTATRMPRIR